MLNRSAAFGGPLEMLGISNKLLRIPDYMQPVSFVTRRFKRTYVKAIGRHHHISLKGSSIIESDACGVWIYGCDSSF